MTLTFGKFKGQDLNNTPYWYQNWLNNQDWFITKFKKAKANPYDALIGWDGYSARGQAAYDAVFEMEKMEGINSGYECKCGRDKFKDDKYCEGDHCKHDF